MLVIITTPKKALNSKQYGTTPTSNEPHPHAQTHQSKSQKFSAYSTSLSLNIAATIFPSPINACHHSKFAQKRLHWDALNGHLCLTRTWARSQTSPQETLLGLTTSLAWLQWPARDCLSLFYKPSLTSTTPLNTSTSLTSSQAIKI